MLETFNGQDEIKQIIVLREMKAEEEMQRRRATTANWTPTHSGAAEDATRTSSL